MKLSPSATIPKKQQAPSKFIPIPFKRFEYGDLDKSEYETYTLRNIAADPNSSTFRINVPYYRGGRSGEEYILFKRNLEKVFTGQNVEDDATMFSIVRRLLQGAALATFNNKVAEYDEEIEEVFEVGMRAVRDAAFPKRAISKQKRYMRRHMHKGINTPFKTFLNRVQEINNYFAEMPPNVPVADGEVEEPPSGMPEDDLMDILEFACPTEWQKQMRLQDFDTSVKSFEELLNFCENLEELEELEKSQTSTKKPSAKKEGHKGKKSHSESSGKKYHCILHGHNNSHNTDDCAVMASQAKKMRGMYNAQPSDRKAKYKQTQELQAIVASSVARAIKGLSKKSRSSRKEVNAFEDMSLSEDSSTKSEEDVEDDSESAACDSTSSASTTSE